MMRIHADGIVRGVPTAGDAARLTARFPDALFRTLVHPGQRLAHLPFQDSYSFEFAELFLGADSQPELLEKYKVARELLPFDIERTEAEPA